MFGVLEISEAFGSSWRGLNSDWSKLSAIRDWDASASQSDFEQDHREILGRVTGRAEITELADRLETRLSKVEAQLNDTSAAFQLDVVVAFAAHSLQEVSLATLAARLSSWCDRPEDLSHWTAFRLR